MLAAFLETESAEGSRSKSTGAGGLVADYDFDTGNLKNTAPTSVGSLIDIGQSCNKPATFLTVDVRGTQKKVLKFDMGTGFVIPQAKDFLGSGSASKYTVSMRVFLDETEGLRRLLNTNFGADHGLYVDRVLRLVPDRPGSHTVTAREWHDIVIMYADGFCKIMIDGAVDKAWKVDAKNKGVMVLGATVALFNDDGDKCSESKENTGGMISRLKIYDQMIPEKEVQRK